MLKLAVILLGVFHQTWSRSHNDQLLPPFTNYLSCGKLYYRTVHLDESRNTLFVGAMDKLFKGMIYFILRQRNYSFIILSEPGQCVQHQL